MAGTEVALARIRTLYTTPDIGSSPVASFHDFRQALLEANPFGVPQENLSGKQRQELDFVLNFAEARTQANPTLLLAWDEGRLKEFGYTTTFWHSLYGGVFGYNLARAIGLDEESSVTVADALYVHDYFKPWENVLLDVGREQGWLDPIASENMKTWEKERLRTMGFLQEIVELSGANVPDDLEGPQTFTGKVVFLIDAMLYGTRLIRPEDRMENGSKQMTDDLERNKRVTRNLARYDLEAQKLQQKGIYIDHDTLQILIARRIDSEFRDRILSSMREIDKEDAVFLQTPMEGLPWFLSKQLELQSATVSSTISQSEEILIFV